MRPNLYGAPAQCTSDFYPNRLQFLAFDPSRKRLSAAGEGAFTVSVWKLQELFYRKMQKSFLLEK